MNPSVKKFSKWRQKDQELKVILSHISLTSQSPLHKSLLQKEEGEKEEQSVHTAEFCSTGINMTLNSLNSHTYKQLTSWDARKIK